MGYEDAIHFFAKDLLLKNVEVPKIKKGRSEGHFNTLAKSIVYQQLSGKAAQTIYNRLLDKCGGKITPENLSRLSEKSYKSVGVSRQKASYLKDLSLKILSKEVNTRRHNRMKDDDIIAELTTVRGIGKWTAQMFLMFSLGREDVFPTGDLGIRKGFMRLLSLDKEPSEAHMETTSERWKPYRTYLSLILWRELDTTNVW